MTAQGKIAEAEALQSQALEIRRKVLEPNHPDLAISYYLIGESLWRQGELNQADALLNTALTLQNKVLGETNSTTLDTLTGLSQVLEAENDWPAAEKTRRHALAMWQLRGEAESSRALSELENLTKDLIAQRKFAEAGQLLDNELKSTASVRPMNGELLYLRCDLKGRHSHFAEAATDAAEAFRIAPADNSRFAELAALYLITHNRPAYDRLREQLLSGYANSTNPFIADQVAKASLFLPAPEAQRQIITRLADVALEFGSNDEGALPFFQLCKALSEYRQNHYAAAEEWAKKACHSPRVEAQESAVAVLAMAYWQLGNNELGKQMLATGDSLTPPSLPSKLADDPSDAWQAWLFARVLLAEANDLINSSNRIDTTLHLPASNNTLGKP